jgi:3-deoxy-D-manno-octulosonate 8-phosphate phosphatase (KDO 8-P phosphatase)
LPKSPDKFPPAILKRAKKIRLLLMDVDGTLTDGRVYLMSVAGAGAAAELKVFNAHDGAGVKLAHLMGIKTGLITGRNSMATAQRAHEMSMDFVYQGRAKKAEAYLEIQQQAGVTDEETAYMGDDLPDLPLLERAGLAIATANAVPEAKMAADYVTHRGGGDGAVREIVELILKAQGKWKAAIPKALA